MEKKLHHSYKRSKAVQIATLITIISLVLTSCITYTYDDAKEIIPPVASTYHTTLSSPEEQGELLITIRTLFLPLPDEMTTQDSHLIAQALNEEKQDLIVITGKQELLDEIFPSLSASLIVERENILIATTHPLVEQEHSYEMTLKGKSKKISFAVIDSVEELAFVDEEKTPKNLLFTSNGQTPSPSYIDSWEINHYQSQLRKSHLYSSNLLPLEVEQEPLIKKAPSDAIFLCIRGTFVVVN
jgi:hypothetical protein